MLKVSNMIRVSHRAAPFTKYQEDPDIWATEEASLNLWMMIRRTSPSIQYIGFGYMMCDFSEVLTGYAAL